jgi:hypothetical protein
VWIIARWVKDPDIRDIMIDINDYAPMDRYRDFIRVFGTPEGKRVLSQILIWGRMNKSTFSPDPYTMALMAGERNLALKIVAGLTQPAELPTERRKK